MVVYTEYRREDIGTWNLECCEAVMGEEWKWKVEVEGAEGGGDSHFRD